MSFHSPNERRRYAEERRFLLNELLKKYKIDNWKQTYSREWAWINQNQSTKYGKSLIQRLEKNGDITENQMKKLREIIGFL
jgi:hypothetical protein